MPKSFLKDPDDILDYKFDFAAETNARPDAAGDWLEAAETISTKTVTAETGITVVSSAITDTGTSVTVWLSGGTAGTGYLVACKVTTSKSRTVEKSINVKCVQQ